MPSAEPPLEFLAARLLAELAPRAKSLLVTIWGDTLFPRGGEVWLGGLIALARPFGLSERLVRTSVQRLGRDDWVSATRVGRHSRYGLTGNGRRRFEDAQRRIYARGPAPWDGEWVLVFSGLGALARDEREALRRELLWLGFGVVAPNVFAHPAADRRMLDHVLRERGAAGRAVVMRGRAEAMAGGRGPVELLRDCWDLAGLSESYRALAARFDPVRAALAAAGESGGEPDAESCFVLRTLFVHEYRRILLRDPGLPEPLLPADWAGQAARRLRVGIADATQGPAAGHVEAVLAEAGPIKVAAGVRVAVAGV